MKGRTVHIAGHRTTMRLELEFWDGLKEIARFKGIPTDAVVSFAVMNRSGGHTSAVRVFVMEWFRTDGGVVF